MSKREALNNSTERGRPRPRRRASVLAARCKTFDLCTRGTTERVFMIINYKQHVHPTEIILITGVIVKVCYRIRAPPHS